MDPRSGSDRLRASALGGQRSLGELVRDLSDDASRLIRQEMALARTELRQNLGALARDAASVALGAALAAVGALVLVAALVAGLGELLGDRHVLAALIVGAALVAAGGLLALRALAEIRRGRVAPAGTLASLRETGGWARAEVEELRAALATALATGQATNGNGRAVPHLRLHRGDRPEVPVSPAPPAADAGARVSAGARRAAARGEPTGPLPVSEPLWKRVKHEFAADDISNQAAKVAYYFFLSLPPALMALFGLAGIFGGEGTASWLTARLQRALPGEASALVDDFVTQTVRSEHPALLSFGLLAALWAASNVMMALEDTLNDAYGVRTERGFVRRRAVALGTLLGVGLLFLAGSVALLAAPAISDALGLGPAGELTWTVAQWPLAFALITGAFWLLYYFLPNKDQSGFRKTLLKSSATAAALWLLATAGFKLYIANFGSYSATYGLLGTVIVLLLWMWMTSLVILLGGEIGSEMERRA